MIDQGSQWGEAREPTRRGFRAPVIPSFPRSCHLLSFVLLHVFLSLPFLRPFLVSQQGVFNIHVLGGPIKYVRHGFRVVLVQREHKLTLQQPVYEGCYKYLVIGLINRECFFVKMGYLGS